MRTADWAALALLAFEVPSILFSLYRANSIGASEVVALSILAYFTLRLAVQILPRRSAFWAAGLAVLVGLVGAWLATSGIFEFATGAKQLAAVGLTDLVAFRSRLIHPIHEWVPGECFTALLLTLPFACAAGTCVWRLRPSKGSVGLASVSFLALLPGGWRTLSF
jgi:hypothetical protein